VSTSVVSDMCQTWSVASRRVFIIKLSFTRLQYATSSSTSPRNFC